MTNTELLAKIKAEIDKRYAEYREKMKTDDFTYYEGMADALDLFEQFIDTLESEKPINPEAAMKELDEKIALVKRRGTWDGVDVDKYMDEVRGREPEKPVPADLEEAAKEFANQDCVTFISRKNGFIAGAKWDRSRIMNEAVEADVNTYQDLVAGKSWAEFVMEMPTNNLGDKVRIIVIPNTDEK